MSSSRLQQEPDHLRLNKIKTPEGKMGDVSGGEPLVQVVVVHFGSWEVTLECLRSLGNLLYPNYQVIVVDNGPQEGGLHLSPAGAFAIQVIRNSENRGFATACNQGILHGRANNASYVWILNNDTEVTSGALSALLSKVENDARMGAVGSTLLKRERGYDKETSGGGHVSFKTGIARHLKNHLPGELDYLCGASLLFRMEALEEVGFFDKEFFLYWEDTDISFRLKKRGWRLGLAETSRVYHRGSCSTVFQSSGCDLHYTASSIRFFSRHSRFWFLPVGISVLGRVVCRAARGKRENIHSIWLGLKKGLAHRVRRGQNPLTDS